LKVPAVSQPVPPPGPHVATARVNECGEALVDVRKVSVLRLAPRLADVSPAGVYLRATVVDQLVTAQILLPRDIRLLILGGHRPPGVEPAVRYCTQPDSDAHLSGGAADLSLCTEGGTELPMGSRLHAGPAERRDLSDFTAEAQRNRHFLHQALSTVGLVNPPTAWWHWSYGDLYWCDRTGAGAACYGPILELP
jgi:zinc D-Ala-D-Ala dipeptidase